MLGSKNLIIAVMAAIGPIAFGLVNAPGIQAQGQMKTETPLTFEVASVKPSKPGATGGGIRPLPGGQTYIATNAPVKLMIKLMYHVTDRQISGGPAWINTDLYDVEAKAERPASLDQLHQMFQNLLVDRFQLKFHRETKEMPCYALVLDKSGSKLKLNESPEPFDFPIKPGGRGKIVGQRVSMSYFTWFLSGLPMVDRPVVDKTGLSGNYDFTLELLSEAAKLPGGDDREPAANPEGPSLFTALREQLGLKLEPQKGPVEIMVIDHAEKPTAN